MKNDFYQKKKHLKKTINDLNESIYDVGISL